MTRHTGNDGPDIGKRMTRSSSKVAQGIHNVATSSVPNSNDNNDNNDTDDTNNIDKGIKWVARCTGNEHGNEPYPRSPSPLILDKQNNDEHPMSKEHSNNSDTDSDSNSNSEHVSSNIPDSTYASLRYSDEVKDTITNSSSTNSKSPDE